VKSIIARIPVKEDKMAEAIEAAKQLMVGVREEEGTLFYTLNVSDSAPDVLVVMERYSSDEAVEVHMATPHLHAFMDRGAELFSGEPEVVIMEELASI